MSLAPLKIGPYELSSPFVLAPMAGVTDAPFRRICRRFGAGMTTSEMTTADTSLWQTPKSRYRLDLDLDAEPVAVQIAGSEPAQLAAAARACVEPWVVPALVLGLHHEEPGGGHLLNPRNALPLQRHTFDQALAARSQAGEAVAKAFVGLDGFRFQKLRRHDDPMFVPGAVKYLDVDGLLALCAPATVHVLAGEKERFPAADRVFAACMEVMA